MRRFYQPKIKDGANYLEEEESRHCKVLRLKEGDQIMVLDGSGGIYTVNIISTSTKKYVFEIVHCEQFQPTDYHIHIAIAPTKNVDRIEWFVEKAVEIGVQEISFIFCENSERKHLKIDRLVKKAISAMKQSLKTYLPNINNPVKFSKCIDSTATLERYIGHVSQTNVDLLFELAQPKKNYTVIIGPEGGFSENELAIALDHKFKKASLGENRLRTETAGIAACHILNLIQEK